VFQLANSLLGAKATFLFTMYHFHLYQFLFGAANKHSFYVIYLCRIFLLNSLSFDFNIFSQVLGGESQKCALKQTVEDFDAMTHSEQSSLLAAPLKPLPAPIVPERLHSSRAVKSPRVVGQ